MHVHRACAPAEINVPHQLQQPVPGENDPRILHHDLQELKFLAGQGHLFAVHAYGMGGPVHLDGTAHQNVLLSLRLRSPQDGLDPRHHLQHAERLAQIIVGPQIQAGHPVILASFGRRHDHRQPLRARRSPDLLQDRDPVLSREHDVQQHKLRQLVLHGRPEGPALRKAFRPIARKLQGIQHHLPYALFIFQTIYHPFTPLSVVRCSARPARPSAIRWFPQSVRLSGSRRFAPAPSHKPTEA